MSQSGATGLSGTPGQISVTLTVGGPASAPPAVTHPGVAGPPPSLPTTGVPLPAEIDAALLAVVAGALIVRLASITSGGTRELLGLRRRVRRGAAS
jgi:hypothetical protein